MSDIPTGPGPLAPVALFTYNRPEHTLRTLAALRVNALAARTHLHIFVDAPRDEQARPGHAAVLDCVAQVSGFASVTVVRRERNLGLAGSIIDGASRLCERYGRVIVLEDDLITSPHFLRYMNDALDHYANVPDVGCVSAYMYPAQVPEGTPDTVMLPFPMSWGWGTWQRAWRLFDADGAALAQRLHAQGLAERFDRLGPGRFMHMLNAQIAGRNNSWYIRWHAALFLAGKTSLAPTRSLINNIGLDGSGVHCSTWRFDPFQVLPSKTPIVVDGAALPPSPRFQSALDRFFLKSKLLRYVNALDRTTAGRLSRVVEQIRPTHERR